jgi:hypothetical protein
VSQNWLKTKEAQNILLKVQVAQSGFDGGSQSSFLSQICGSSDYKSKCLDTGSNNMANFSLSYELDDELRVELEMIEQKFQEAIRDLSRKRWLKVNLFCGLLRLFDQKEMVWQSSLYLWWEIKLLNKDHN